MPWRATDPADTARRAAVDDQTSAEDATSAAKTGMPPIIGRGARLLILGTLPGDQSLRRRQYYAHPRNSFWPLVAALEEDVAPVAYARRVALLKRRRIALWDVLRSATRTGSLDTAIRNAVPNDFEAFFARHPGIAAVAFNGQKARDLFRRHVASEAALENRGIAMLVLPSSSPTHVKPFPEKLAAWQAALVPYQNFLAR